MEVVWGREASLMATAISLGTTAASLPAKATAWRATALSASSTAFSAPPPRTRTPPPLFPAWPKNCPGYPGRPSPPGAGKSPAPGAGQARPGRPMAGDQGEVPKSLEKRIVGGEPPRTTKTNQTVNILIAGPNRPGEKLNIQI
jgi:hypothetical protein